MATMLAFITTDAAICKEPVSYTHLDVYKRQHYYYATAHADVDHKMEQFCEKIKGSTLKYAKEQVDLFESDDNLDVGIVDQEGHVVYAVTSFSERERLKENPYWKLVKGATLSEKELRDVYKRQICMSSHPPGVPPETFPSRTM